MLFKDFCYFNFLLLLQLVLCRVATLKVSLYIILSTLQGYSEKSEIHYRFRFILLPTFFIFGSVWIILVFVSTILLKVAKDSISLWLYFAKSKGSLKRQWPISCLIDILTALNGPQFYSYLLLLLLVLCRVETLKSLPVHYL